MRFQLALEDISVDVDNLIEMLIILKYATITQIGQEPDGAPYLPIINAATFERGIEHGEIRRLGTHGNSILRSDVCQVDF